MAQLWEQITPELQAFIEAQPLFFVASAPLDPNGHVNLSPKGLDTLRVLSPNRVAYLDLTGSGNETSAHLAENGRITFMFCSFNGPAHILRLYGTGRTILPESAEWNGLVPGLPDYPGARQIILADIARVQTSCGYGVPLMEFKDQRETLIKWAQAKGDTLEAYRREKNSRSLDGLPAPLAGGRKPAEPEGKHTGYTKNSDHATTIKINIRQRQMSSNNFQTVPVLRIFDEEKAKDFYVGFLGFSVDWEHRFHENAPLYMQVSRENLVLHLSEHHGDACPGSTTFVRLTNLEDLHAELTSKGYSYMRPGIEIAPWNAKLMEVTDPFGNKLRFNEDLNEKTGQTETIGDQG